jgi:ribulose-phosphate 3-epimerase
VNAQERLQRFAAAPRPVVLPSLLGCDFARMADELAALAAAGAHAAHLDVMDGHFVPNLTYGPPVIRGWRPASDLFFDAHLMIAEPGRYLDAFLEAGCDQVTIHVEVAPDPSALLRAIRAAGAHAGLSLNPPTPVGAIEPYLDLVDQVLVMSVMPGFGGQSFDASAREKVRRLRALRPGLPIAVDGGIKPSNAAEVVADGATHLVVGSAIFGGDRGVYRAAIEAVRSAAAGGSSP